MPEIDIVDQIIASGDRAGLKHWLQIATDEMLLQHWITISCCGVQDFSELTQITMLKRGIFRRG